MAALMSWWGRPLDPRWMIHQLMCRHLVPDWKFCTISWLFRWYTDILYFDPLKAFGANGGHVDLWLSLLISFYSLHIACWNILKCLLSQCAWFDELTLVHWNNWQLMSKKTWLQPGHRSLRCDVGTSLCRASKRSYHNVSSFVSQPCWMASL